MKKTPILIIRVEANRSAEFPIDMLRYDAAYPLTEQDSAAITRTHADPSDPKRRTVDLIVTANHAPNEARWNSFGWNVKEHRTDTGHWTPYMGERVWK